MPFLLPSVLLSIAPLMLKHGLVCSCYRSVLPPFSVRKRAKPLVKDRLKSWKEGSFLNLWSEACNRARSLSIRHHFSDNIKRARAAVQNGRFRKALQSLVSLGLAPPDASIFFNSSPWYLLSYSKFLNKSYSLKSNLSFKISSLCEEFEGFLELKAEVVIHRFSHSFLS